MIFLLPEEPDEAPRGGTAARLWRDVGSRVMFWLGAAVLAVGSVVLLVTLLGEEDPRGPLPAAPTVTQDQTELAAIDPEARRVAGQFILTAVARKNLAKSWDLVHPSMRAGLTKAQWVRGEIPVTPYPVASIDEARFRVDAVERNLIQLDVALVPKDGSQTAGVFQIGLVAVGKGKKRHWLVDYWGPAGAPGVRAPPR